MHSTGKIHEKFLTEIWKKQNFSNLYTRDGQKLEIIDSGIENVETSGPDFKNARIKIGNITYCGDIEIDSFYSDWRSHAHNINKHYNKVILHVVLSKDNFKSFVTTQDGRKVPSICLKDHLSEDLSIYIKEAIEAERGHKNSKIKCSEAAFNIDKAEKIAILTQLGVNRFREKSSKLLERLKEIIYVDELKSKEPMIRYSLDERFYDREFTVEDFNNKDPWNQLLYESIFEALGYSHNKNVMSKLAKQVELKYLNKFVDEEIFQGIIESVLFNVSGIIPKNNDSADENIVGYKRDLIETWANLKYKYDGKMLTADNWQFLRLRPQNFPTLRVVGGARYAYRLLRENYFNKILNCFKKTYDPRRITSDLRNHLIIKADGFWKHHYVFHQKSESPISYFVGISRVDEIMINVVLPIASMYFQIFDKKEYSERALKVYLNLHQETDNHLVNDLSDAFGVEEAKRRSVLYQGVIELFRNFCSKDRCLECPIGIKVFNG